MSSDAVRPHLAPGEAIAWTGRPDPSDLARRSAGSALAGAIFGAGFALFAPRFGFQGALLVVPWLFCALSLAAPFFAYRRAARTVYAVTDRRALIVTGDRVRSIGPGRLGHPVIHPRSGTLADVDFGVVQERTSSPDGTSHDVQRRTGFLAITGAQAAEGALRELLGRLSRTASRDGRIRHPVLAFSFAAPPGFVPTTVEPRIPGKARRALSLRRKVDPSELDATDWGAVTLDAPGGASCRVEVREQAERPTPEALAAELGGKARWVLGKGGAVAEREVPPFGRAYELVHSLPMGIELRNVICFPPGLQITFTYANRNATADLYGPFFDAILGSLEAGPPAPL